MGSLSGETTLSISSLPPCSMKFKSLKKDRNGSLGANCSCESRLELQIRGGIEDNSKIISQRKHVVTPH